ncbi:MAG TPA: Crp/Fnr family transcriptional regulator [Bacillota bacterium]|nr:Crp/Fnr family transcriptional regulator [Bacillota bacterium]
MFQKWQEQLSGCRLFQTMLANELVLMLDCLKPKLSGFSKNDLITIAGEQFGGIGIVLSGSVVVTKENLAGNRVIMDILGPGELFGEMVAFSKHNVWPATIVAQNSCEVLFIPPEKIVGGCGNLCVAHRQLTVNMLRIVSDKAWALHRKVEYLALGSLREKISRFLLEQYRTTGKPLFMLPLNRNELAEFLNTTRPSLSREFCRMRDEGLIEFHRSSIRIKDIQTLSALLE